MASRKSIMGNSMAGNQVVLALKGEERYLFRLLYFFSVLMNDGVPRLG